MKIDSFSLPYLSAHGSLGNPSLDSPETLVLVFGPSDCLDHTETLRTLTQTYPHSHILGCSTAGEIHGSEIADNTLSVAIVRFESTRLRSAAVPIQTAESSFSAGVRIAQSLMDEDLRAILVLSDGLQVNGSELVRGLNSILPANVVVTGGLAGDGDRFRRTWVFHDGAPTGGYVTAVGLYGTRIRIGHGSKGGWDMFGPERTVTKSKDNVLFELDGKPALELYKTYLGDRASGLPATGLLFPLALRGGAGESNQLVRTILAVDEASQSMTFAGNIPQGSLAQLMRANFDRLIEGAASAASSSNFADTDPILAVAISCVGRRLILGERAEEETEAVQDALPPGAYQVGFYSYGEISPFAAGRCDLHNQTMTLMTIGEA